MNIRSTLFFLCSIIVFGIALGFSSGENAGNSKTGISNNRTFSNSDAICVYSWTNQTSATSNQLFCVSAVSMDVGWAGGAAGTVRRTINGSTWTNANPNPGVIDGDVKTIFGIDENTALCGTSPFGLNIYKTVNGGTNWVRVYNSEGNLNSIKMVSATEGYALGDPRPIGAKWLILKTVDGGNTWARIPTEPNSFSSIEFGYDNCFQILGTNMWFGTNTTRVYHSTDMGVTWSSAETPGSDNISAVHFNSTSAGLAGGDAMKKSTDGGVSYISAVAPGPGGMINGLEGDETNYWCIRSGLDVHRSTDLGNTWTVAHSQGVGNLHDIDLVMIDNCPQGWVVGNAGAISKLASLTGISNSNNEIPSSYSLKQNFPNPFNPSTNINFSIPVSGVVTLKVFDLTGKEVAQPVNEFKNAGNYVIGFNASDLPSGAYFYKMESDNFSDTKKMMLIK